MRWRLGGQCTWLKLPPPKFYIGHFAIIVSRGATHSVVEHWKNDSRKHCVYLYIFSSDLHPYLSTDHPNFQRTREGMRSLMIFRSQARWSRCHHQGPGRVFAGNRIERWRCFSFSSQQALGGPFCRLLTERLIQ